jgi:hypothetical protein
MLHFALHLLPQAYDVAHANTQQQQDLGADQSSSVMHAVLNGVLLPQAYDAAQGWRTSLATARHGCRPTGVMHVVSDTDAACCAASAAAGV